MPYDCFISYASADLPIAEDLHRRLTAEGFSVWFDKARLDSGCDWHKEIEQGCENSRILLPVLTPRWKLSEWTRYETYGAEAIIPLIFEKSWADVATPPLERFQAEKVDVQNLEDAGWEKLWSSLRRLLDSPMPLKQNRLVHLHYRPNDHFVGRDFHLIRIHEELHCNPRAVLTQGRVRAITAMGGVGKTTLARQYAEKFWRCYPQIFWVDVRQGLDIEFAELHDLLFPDRADIGLKVPDKARQALRELHSQDTRLLIIDNAEDEESVIDYIPKTGGCHTLITSRFAGWSEAVKTFYLFVLEKEPSIQFLYSRTGRTPADAERDACEQLAEKLGYLPLALEQAAAYIKKQRLQFADYLRIYEKARRDLLAKKALGSTEYPDSVITTWKPTVAKLQPGARAILHMTSCMASTPIRIAFFISRPDLVIGLTHLFCKDDELALPSDFEFWIREEIGNLHNYSLVLFDGDALTLHPLLQTVEYETQSTEERRLSWSAATQILETSAPVPVWKDDYRQKWSLENEKLWKQLLPHVQRLQELREKVPGLPLSQEFEILSVNTYASQKQFQPAISICERLCDQLAATGVEADAQIIEARDSLAYLLRLSGQYREALEAFRSVHELRCRVFGEDHRDTLRALHNVAIVLKLLGDSGNAESVMRTVLEQRRQVLGEDDYDTVTSVHDLGWLLNGNGRIDQAEPLSRHATERWSATLGADHPDTLTSVNNLAGLLKSKRAYDEAEPLYRRALEGRKRVLGANHPDTLTSLSDLAGLLEAKGEYAQVEPFLRSALEGCERVLGADHPDTLTSVNNLAVLLDSKRAYGEAESLYRRALEGCERVLRHNHPNTRDITKNIRHCRMRQGRLKRLWCLFPPRFLIGPMYRLMMSLAPAIIYWSIALLYPLTVVGSINFCIDPFLSNPWPNNFSIVRRVLAFGCWIFLCLVAALGNLALSLLLRVPVEIVDELSGEYYVAVFLGEFCILSLYTIKSVIYFVPSAPALATFSLCCIVGFCISLLCEWIILIKPVNVKGLWKGLWSCCRLLAIPIPMFAFALAKWKPLFDSHLGAYLLWVGLLCPIPLFASRLALSIILRRHFKVSAWFG